MVSATVWLGMTAIAQAEDAPRFAQPTMEQLNPEQQAVAAEVGIPLGGRET